MRSILEAMVEKKVGKLLHGGEEAKVDRRRRSGRLSLEFLEPAVVLTLSWVGGKRFGLMEPIPRPRIFKSNHRSGSTGRESGSSASGYQPVPQAVVPRRGRILTKSEHCYRAVVPA